jgi:hypothetical protein
VVTAACNGGGDDDVSDVPSQSTVTEEARAMAAEVAALFDASVDERLVGEERCRDDSQIYISLWAEIPLGRPAEEGDLATIGEHLVAAGFDEVSSEESRGSFRRYWERAETQEAFEAFAPKGGEDHLRVTAVSRCAEPDGESA